MEVERGDGLADAVRMAGACCPSDEVGGGTRWLKTRREAFTQRKLIKEGSYLKRREKVGE